jgi:hypothetical protein
MILPFVFTSCSDKDDDKDDCKETDLKIFECIIGEYDHHFYTPKEHYVYTINLDVPLNDIPYPSYSYVFIDDTLQYFETTNELYNNYRWNYYTEDGVDAIKITSMEPLTGRKFKIRFFHSKCYIAEW